MRYLTTRLFLSIPTILLTVTFFFFLIRLVPGDIVDARLAEAGYSAEQAERLREEYGLTDPLLKQYGSWLFNLLTGDPGDSFQSGAPVIDTIIDRVPVTIELSIMAIVIALVISLPIGVISATRQDSLNDYLLRGTSILFISVPSFWVATLVLVFPSKWWSWAPRRDAVPFFDDPAANLEQFIIPSAILGMFLAGATMRITRAMMLEVLRQDYIRTARAKGLSETIVVMRHALKNAFLPVLTIIGLQVAFLVGGTVIIEEIFGLQGIGQLFLESVTRRDYPMLQAVGVYVAISVIFINLLVDLLYTYLDPRIRY